MEGTFDLVGNNIPVFFIQDGLKFPDIVHAAKPHPDREIPQAQSAHDTFWDFVSLHTEATHHVMWQMSDRAVPRSFRMMEGFGIHTFRLVDQAGGTTLVKFHWKPVAGVHSLVWEEAQLACGMDPDFHRRDLADAIEAGAYPEWELGIQAFPDTEDQTFHGIDLLDPTKIVPEELAPVQLIGRLTLNRNPINYFAETEQVAFHPGHLVPGIEVTDDPLLQARLFSYLDTQISRLGGPNFAQLPINRPHAPVNDMLRDGMHQTAVHGGVAPYRPNSLDGGCPFQAGVDIGGYVEVSQPVPAGPRVRELPRSFDDHISQARMFWLSLSEVERDHLVGGFTFELSKCFETPIRERMLAVLSGVDTELCARVAAGLGLAAPEPAGPLPDVRPSPALSQGGRSWPVTGRVIGLVTDGASDLAAVAAVRDAAHAAGMTPLIIAPIGGTLTAGPGPSLTIQRTYQTARSIEFDAVVVAGGLSGEPDPRIALLLAEAYRHCKALGGWDSAANAFTAVGLPADGPGLVVSGSPTDVLAGIAELLATHRVWDRVAAGERP